MAEQDKVNEDVFGDASTETPEVEITPADIEEPKELSDIEKVIFEEHVPEGEEPAQPETPEAENSEQFYQTSYQKTMELLKQTDPTLHQQIKQELKQDRTQAQELLEPEPVQTEVDSDDPMAQIREMRKALAELPKVLRGEVTRAQQEATAKQQYASEYDNAERALGSFVAENKIPPEQVKSTLDYVNSLGVDVNRIGGPTAAVKMMLDRFRTTAILAHAESKNIQAQADGEVKAIAANQVAQPAPGAMPEQPPKTRDQKLLEAMQKSGTSDAGAEVFG